MDSKNDTDCTNACMHVYFLRSNCALETDSYSVQKCFYFLRCGFREFTVFHFFLYHTSTYIFDEERKRL